MKFDRPLLRLPIRFSADRLAAEVRGLPPSAWQPHPQGFAGNDAVPLVSAGGALNDTLRGAMAPTEHLPRCPYIMHIMAEIGGVWGRSRLMGLAPGAEVPGHVDTHYYWRTHIRIHIPVITNPGVTFTCGGESVHMAAGECWVFDSFQAHNVQNGGAEHRVHLVLDTVGGDRLWELIDRAAGGEQPPVEPWLPQSESLERPLAFEQSNKPKIMSPWEIRCHAGDIASYAPPGPALERVMKRVDRFASAWQSVWAQFAEADEGLPLYRGLVDEVRADLQAMRADSIMLTNKVPLAYALDSVIFVNATTLAAVEPAARKRALS